MPHASGWVRLHHGTFEDMGESLVTYGVDREKAEEFGTGQFWTTLNVARADCFSQVALVGSGRRVILSFDLPIVVINGCLTETPYPWAWEHPWEWEGQEGMDYEFLPMSFPVLNENMKNITLTFRE